MNKLYYCLVCKVVAAFDMHEIRKQGLALPWDRKCPVSQAEGYCQVEEDLA